jgi:hypothetical protein
VTRPDRYIVGEAIRHDDLAAVSRYIAWRRPHDAAIVEALERAGAARP